MLISLTSETDKRSATSTSPGVAHAAYPHPERLSRRRPLHVATERLSLRGNFFLVEQEHGRWLQVTAPVVWIGDFKPYHAVISSTSASPNVLLLVNLVTLATAAAPSTLD